jgi:hypothetical protein
MNEFQPKLVLDSRINDISDKVDVAVESSAAQSTYQSFPSVNSSNSSITWNVNVPSENIAIDRRVLIKSNLFFTVNIGAGVAEGDQAFQWGVTDGFGEFPFNSLFSQVQATINNVSVSTPSEDIMAPLLRLCDQKEVSKMNKSTASYIDQNYYNIEGLGSEFQCNNNPVSGLSGVAYDSTIQPNGCLVPYNISVKQYNAGVEVTGLNDPNISASDTNTFVVEVSVSVTEPLLFLSPFSGLVKSKNDACLLGINNMNIVANINTGNLNKFFKTTVTSAVRTVSLGFSGNSGFGSPQLLLNLLTLQPEQYSRINTRNVLPIQDYPRFVSTSNSNFLEGATQTFTFPVIQLNQVPDTILAFIRPSNSSLTGDDKHSLLSGYATINNASVSFNNQSGILASCSQEELYNLSQANGSKQTYNDFIGQISTLTSSLDDVTDDSGNLTGSTVLSQSSITIPTQGSILVMKPAYNFNLPSYLSAGSLGQFGLQIQMTCTNYLDTITNPEMVVICVNSGLMVTQQGSSSLYSGLLTKNMVLETKQKQPAMDSSTFSSLTGGSVQESCNTGLRKVLKKHFGSKGGGFSGGGLSAGSDLGDKVGQVSGAINKMSKYI